MAGRDAAGRRRVRPGWPHRHGTFSLGAGAARPASRGPGGRGTAGRVVPRTADRTEPTQARPRRYHQVLRPDAGPGRFRRRRRSRGPAGGESRAPPLETFTVLSGRPGGRVTPQPPARLRPAAIRRPAVLAGLAAT